MNSFSSMLKRKVVSAMARNIIRMHLDEARVHLHNLVSFFEDLGITSRRGGSIFVL
jgi:hypothetical protein